MKYLGEMAVNVVECAAVIDQERAILATLIIALVGGIIFLVRNRQNVRRLLGHDGK